MLQNSAALSSGDWTLDLCAGVYACSRAQSNQQSHTPWVVQCARFFGHRRGGRCPSGLNTHRQYGPHAAAFGSTSQPAMPPLSPSLMQPQCARAHTDDADRPTGAPCIGGNGVAGASTGLTCQFAVALPPARNSFQRVNHAMLASPTPPKASCSRAKEALTSASKPSRSAAHR